MPTAVITGGSAGLGRALAEHLADRSDPDPWHLVLVSRRPGPLAVVATRLRPRAHVTTVVGDVAHPAVAERLASVLGAEPLALLVNNASELGPSPLPRLAEVSPAELRRLFEVNVEAPVRLFQALRANLRAAAGVVVNVTSDAAAGPWPGWGPYGASKAALDQISNVLGAEESALSVYALDPGDMRTAMHRAAFPGEDISDRPEPGTVAPVLSRLLDRRPPSGRYRAAALLAPAAATRP